MTTIYTSIVEKHFWQWCKAPLVHTGFKEPIKFAKQSVIVLYSQYIEKRYFGNQTPVVPDAIVEHLKNDPASFLVFENNSECYWPPHRENFWNQVYQNTVQRGFAKQQIHFYSSVKADDFSKTNNKGILHLIKWFDFMAEDIQNTAVNESITLEEIIAKSKGFHDLLTFFKILSERGYKIT